MDGSIYKIEVDEVELPEEYNNFGGVLLKAAILRVDLGNKEAIKIVEYPKDPYMPSIRHDIED